MACFCKLKPEPESSLEVLLSLDFQLVVSRLMVTDNKGNKSRDSILGGANGARLYQAVRPGIVRLDGT